MSSFLWSVQGFEDVRSGRLRALGSLLSLRFSVRSFPSCVGASHARLPNPGGRLRWPPCTNLLLSTSLRRHTVFRFCELLRREVLHRPSLPVQSCASIRSSMLASRGTQAEWPQKSMSRVLIRMWHFQRSNAFCACAFQGEADLKQRCEICSGSVK